VLGARLFPDMFPLTRQVQLTCDFAKNHRAAPRGPGAAEVEDKESTFAELQARIAKTIEFVKGFKARRSTARRSAT
jgi:hypothetical protein